MYVAMLVGLAYVAWLSYEQWSYYLGWPEGAWRQGLHEFGWPTRFLVKVWRAAPDEQWKWSIPCLLINSTFSAVLGFSVGAIAFRMLRAVLTGSWTSFSLVSLFHLTTAVALVFPLWQSILAVGRIEEGEYFLWVYSACPIPITMWILVQVGLFAAAWCLVLLAIAAGRSFVKVTHRAAVVPVGQA